MGIYNFTIDVVGGSFRLKKLTRRMLADRVGQSPVRCYFELEPDNKVDPFAVKVMLNEFIPEANIGYVKRPENKPLFQLLDKLAIVTKADLFEYDDNGYGKIELVLTVDET